MYLPIKSGVNQAILLSRHCLISPGADPAPQPLDSSQPTWYLRKQVELFDLPPGLQTKDSQLS